MELSRNIGFDLYVADGPGTDFSVASEIHNKM